MEHTWTREGTSLDRASTVDLRVPVSVAQFTIDDSVPGCLRFEAVMQLVSGWSVLTSHRFPSRSLGASALSTEY